MKDKQRSIRILQKCHDTNATLADEDKEAIKAGITALRKDQLMEVVERLLPLLGPLASALIQQHK
jgi:hypothetical protein